MLTSDMLNAKLAALETTAAADSASPGAGSIGSANPAPGQATSALQEEVGLGEGGIALKA